MEFIQEFEFDIMRKFTKRIKVKQEDTARKLKMYLYANGEPISLVDKTVRIYALKPDGKIVYNGCTISATTTNLIEVPLTSQLAAVPGTVKCELCIIEGESILSSTQFNILVEGKVRNDDAVISTNEFKDVFTPITLICKKHGVFTETPYKLIARNANCPKCLESVLETEIKQMLT